MLTMPEVRRSELNAVRQLLLSVRDDERTAQAACAARMASPPLRVRLGRLRYPGRVDVAVDPCTRGRAVWIA